MARFSIFSVAVVTILLSGVSAGLIPNLLPSIPTLVPLSKQAAVNQINRGAGIGRGKINAMISLHLELVNVDPTLTPECKQCIAERANATRAECNGQIDTVRESLVDEILNLGLLDSLAAVWVNLMGNLFGPGGLISQIVEETNQSLQEGKCGCMQQTMNRPCPSRA